MNVVPRQPRMGWDGMNAWMGGWGVVGRHLIHWCSQLSFALLPIRCWERSAEDDAFRGTAAVCIRRHSFRQTVPPTGALSASGEDRGGGGVSKGPPSTQTTVNLLLRSPPESGYVEQQHRAGPSGNRKLASQQARQSALHTRSPSRESVTMPSTSMCFVSALMARSAAFLDVDASHFDDGTGYVAAVIAQD
ncbi:hypothetical protein K437DRAFT_25653 [Tilletiaria anomala UBC 951]|uniref:Uncharacterized protein n=1 Tax=Tilletiaria anomala (strain ATCC 24038 / CBS 436.72 / UBC 951) TaxID=1037660 RepID=A0A066WE81_TILAU|nr:uncharacterized protein K437DRAFT_25653 [Tilletiaria anomala UBC 951]KDN52262.1 hypothetical protein K437DRAFT_25653 [Tilletiaria anomala UBC 951]